MKFELSALAAVSMKTTLKYRRDWNKNGPTVQLLRKLMPDKTGYRLYIPIGSPSTPKHVVVPIAVRHALRVAGYRATDYAAKKCVKLKDKEQKNIFNIGKVIGKDPVAKAAFDNDPQLQNTASNSEFQMVVSCHPYDIIGMSTGRDWDNTSCMRLKDGREGMRDGAYSEHLEHDVAEGTLVVYVIKSEDTNLQKPLLRCLLKPFHNDDDSSIILYRRETRIYGNNVPGFAETLAKFIRTLNKGIPPGFYKLNEKLYEDGVGTEVNYLGGDRAAMPKWEDGNVEDHLAERPELFPSYVQFICDSVKKETDPEEQRDNANSLLRQMFMYYIGKIDAKYIKQAGRVLATSPLMVQALYNRAVEDEELPRIGDLMRAKELREAIKNVKRKPRAESGEDVRDMMTFFSPSIQKEYAHHLEEDYDVGVAAIKLISDQIKLRTSDILASPRLHAYVWYMADLTRNGLLYGVSVHQAAAHRLLAVLPKPEPLQINMTEMSSAMYGNSPSEMVPLLGVMYLTAVKDGDTKLVNSMRGYVPGIMANTFKERKFRRAFLALPLDKEISEMIRERISDGDLTPDAERDFLVYMKANGLDCNSWINLRHTLSNKEEWLPYLYYNQIEEDLDTIDYLLESKIRAFLRPYVEWKKPLVAINQFQQLLFDFVGSACSVRDVPPTLPFEFKTEEILPHILTSRHLLSTGASFKKYPQALDKYSAESIRPLEFIGNDLGVSSMVAFETGRSLNDAVRLMEVVFRSCASSTHIALEMGPEGGTTGLPRARMMRIATRGGEVAVEGFKKGLAYCSKLLSFVETYPSYAIGSKQKLLEEGYKFYEETHTKADVDMAFPAIRDLAYLFATEMDDLQERVTHMVRQFANEDDAQADTYRELAKPVQLTIANWRDKGLSADGESS